MKLQKKNSNKKLDSRNFDSGIVNNRKKLLYYFVIVIVLSFISCFYLAFIGNYLPGPYIFFLILLLSFSVFVFLRNKIEKKSKKKFDIYKKSYNENDKNVKLFNSIGNILGDFKISKFTSWLNSVMTIENDVELEYSRFEKLKFILDDKIYAIKLQTKTNNSKSSKDIKIELFEDKSEPSNVTRDPLFVEAAVLILSFQEASFSLIERRLNVDYNRATKIMKQLEEARIVGPFRGSKTREILIASEAELNELLNKELDF
jgi:hypothetical protein